MLSWMRRTLLWEGRGGWDFCARSRAGNGMTFVIRVRAYELMGPGGAPRIEEQQSAPIYSCQRLPKLSIEPNLGGASTALRNCCKKARPPKRSRNISRFSATIRKTRV